MFNGLVGNSDDVGFGNRPPTIRMRLRLRENNLDKTLPLLNGKTNHRNVLTAFTSSNSVAPPLTVIGNERLVPTGKIAGTVAPIQNNSVERLRFAQIQDGPIACREEVRRIFVPDN